MNFLQMQHGLLTDTRAQRDGRKDRRTDGRGLQKNRHWLLRK